ncbi:hypothetical protein [Streptomyces sp. NPDC059928]|uniref:DUF7167 family protein n=1 Tax=unclassified Streptomyces TaxID=2593676 RepID=UPI00365A501E
MNETVTLHLVVDTGFVGATHEDYIEVARSEWEAMTPKEREAYKDEATNTLLWNHFEMYAEVID